MLVALKALGRAFFEICCLRRRPQDLPASGELLAVVLVGYALASMGLTMVFHPAAPALAAGAAECALVAALNYALLYLRSVPQRWLQTTTAMAGTGLLFTLFAIPVFMLMDLAFPGAVVARPALYGAVFLLLAWNVAVMAHILRHALSLSFPAALVIAVAYLWIIGASVGLLVPQPAAP